jgi:hypothetical protein
MALPCKTDNEGHQHPWLPGANRATYAPHLLFCAGHRTQDAKTFDKVRADEKFSYIVALARTINAVNYAHSMLEFERKIETPAAIRNRINSYLFASSIRYEALMLIRKLTRTFKNDKSSTMGCVNSWETRRQSGSSGRTGKIFARASKIGEVGIAVGHFIDNTMPVLGTL